MNPPALVRVVRSELPESEHVLDVAVVDAGGRLVACAGDPDRTLYARSSMKPLQASVSLSLSGLEFPDDEIAVMCASHNAEPVHVDTVRRVLSRAGVSEEALRCPPMRPWDEQAAAASPERRPINSDCSGKHAGMLAACRGAGWPLEGYREPEHPLQRAILQAVLAASGLPEVAIGVDGCGVAVHAMSLERMARIYARLTDPGGWDGLGEHVRRAIAAMLAEPYLVAGRGRVDTALMQAAPGIVAKGGAEGLLCAAALGPGLGVAVRVRDGASRATGPVLIRTLELMGLLDEQQLGELRTFARPSVLGGGKPVGELAAEVPLVRLSAPARGSASPDHRAPGY